MSSHKFILSGGGTGGHIFPAVAIANELKKRHPDAQFLFIGALGRMEMEKIPAEGFEITGLPVQGLKRKLTLKNITVAWNFLKSYFKAKQIIKNFKPDAAIGTGGYVSLPVIYAAQKERIPTIIWEGNGHAGLANKILAKRAQVICTGLPNMDSYFPKEKIHFTGNPIRDSILQPTRKTEALEHFKLSPEKKTVFITGGSLGAKNINKGIMHALPQLLKQNIQVIWQTGKSFTEKVGKESGYVSQFIYEMNLAFNAADLVVSRAGAISISEICALKKPSILVPSPNVTDDHQTKNAEALSSKKAAVLIKDSAHMELGEAIVKILTNPVKMEQLSRAIAPFAKPKSTAEITDLIEKELR
jgi:UDP-N-acetylglucosamine--N-acetylmuramyl-(pentapeptide) pyrophosphoryl-undecaprenol N-acetylglucosamine transferase